MRTKGLCFAVPPQFARCLAHSSRTDHPVEAVTGFPVPVYTPSGFLRQIHQATFSEGLLGRLSALGTPFLEAAARLLLLVLKY
jgi:hypothetical protein